MCSYHTHTVHVDAMFTPKILTKLHWTERSPRLELYLCTVLGLGHSDQELENGLGLWHQRGDGVDDRCELGVRFNTWKTTGRLLNAVQETAVSHICELKPLLPKHFRRTWIVKVCVEEESGGKTTKMSQPPEMQLFRPDLKHWIRLMWRSSWSPSEQTSKSWCGFKFTLMSCWNEATEAENEQEIRYWLRRIIEDVQLFLI